MLKDAGSLGWKGRWRMTWLLLLSGEEDGPVYVLAQVMSLWKRGVISFVAMGNQLSEKGFVCMILSC